MYKLVKFLLILCLWSPLSVSASSLVLDYADLLTEQEEQALTRTLLALSEQEGLQVGAVLYSDSSLPMSLLSYMKQVECPPQFGENRVVMGLNLATRDMVIEVNGTGNSRLNDGQLDAILDKVAPYFTNSEFSTGFSVFVTETELYLNYMTSTEYIQQQNEKKTTMVLLSLFTSLLVASGVTFAFVKSMNNVRDQSDATAYVPEGGVNITHDRETFLYRRVTKIPRQQSSPSGGGGGGGGHSGGRGRSF